jgi:hypothetical protein
VRLAKSARPVEEVMVSIQRMLQQERARTYSEGILVLHQTREL